MIDEKKQIELCRELKEKENGAFSKGYNKALRDIVSTIKSNSFPKVGEWIPVSERLPEEEDTYLVAWLPAYKDEKGETFTCHCQYPHYYMLANYREDEEWDFKLPSVFEEAILLAWMPLPEPYRKDVE